MSDPQLKSLRKNEALSLGNVDLTEAIHLICHAGYPDPRSEFSEDDREELLQRVINDLCALSMHDGLTGLTNLRYFQIALKREAHRSARDGTPCSLLMLDIDHFKAINDNYGHPAGDRALQTVANRLKTELRPGDTLSRYGGEEFTVILPNCALRYAIQAAERLRSSIAEKPIAITEETERTITISIGIAETQSTSEPDLIGFVKKADQNLYKAKAMGRNQVCYDPSITTEVSHEEKVALFKKPEKTKTSNKR